MADTTTVATMDEFVEAIVGDDDLNLSTAGAEELWRVWSYRYENGADDDVLVALPEWFAQQEFGKNRPYFFAQIEYDDDSKGAILFDDARLIDINVVENEIWDDVTITETLRVLDQTEDNDHIDEKGLVWTPRSLMHIFERRDSPDDGSLSDFAASGYDG